jgi:hypothetical protein
MAALVVLVAIALAGLLGAACNGGPGPDPGPDGRTGGPFVPNPDGGLFRHDGTVFGEDGRFNSTPDASIVVRFDALLGFDSAF